MLDSSTFAFVIRRIAVGLPLAWLVVLAELAVVALARRARLASIWELQFGSLWLLPTALALAVPPALAGGALLAVLEQPSERRKNTWVAIVTLSAVAVAIGVSTGRHFEAWPARAGFIGVVATAAAIAARFAFVRLAAALASRPRAFAGAALGVVVALELVNRFVLVRLYPAFHVALAAAALAVAPSIQLLFRSPRLERLRVRWLVAVAAVVAVVVVTARPAAARLAYFDNFRMLLLHEAPLWSEAVRAAARLSPPAPLVSEGPACVGAACSGSAAVNGASFEGFDLLLVTVDALRADHVGAYGYERATTPEIDRLAREGALFEHAYCATPHTSYSITSMMTGKYMRPLLLQNAGYDSDTLATLLRTYGFKTAAFYPPAVFFIDQARFSSFEESGFGFEYRKVEFAEGAQRVQQIERYLRERSGADRLFLWVHLFGPHEPYVTSPDHVFGDRDVDRYDSEVAAADRTVGAIVRAVQKRSRRLAVIVSADHGEEFGDHGGRYHGTTVYEEQVRVPLVVWAPERVEPRRIAEPVQTVDILPTVLDAYAIPRPPRVRGRSLRPLLAGEARAGDGFAFAETEESTLLAKGVHRLICARKVGACALYDIEADPEQRDDRSRHDVNRLEAMRAEVDALTVSHGKFETAGLRAEGRGWPPAILRGITGDTGAAADVAALLEDADRQIRRKAAEILFELAEPATAPALRLALRRDEDAVVRNWAALALTRLGEGAPLARELMRDGEPSWRRLAALALAESGDRAGEAILVDWWMHGAPDDYDRALELLDAFRDLKTKNAVWPLVQTMGNVRLRPAIAKTLAAIGDDSARGPLAKALAEERYQGTRSALVEALVTLGGEYELVRPLLRFLGTPDPIQRGLELAARAGILEHVGGPDRRHLGRLRKEASLGAAIQLVVPKGGNGRGYRVLVRARAPARSGEVRISSGSKLLSYDRKGMPVRSRKVPEIDRSSELRIPIPRTADFVEIAAPAPPSLGLRPALAAEVVVYAEHGVEVDSMAIVPLADELPPPAPKPWKPNGGTDAPPPDDNP